jgi:hypothetical protein
LTKATSSAFFAGVTAYLPSPSLHPFKYFEQRLNGVRHRPLPQTFRILFIYLRGLGG